MLKVISRTLIQCSHGAGGYQNYSRHGVVGSVDDLKKFRDFVAESIDVVQKTLPLARLWIRPRRTRTLLEKYNQWRNGGRWLEAVYKSLTAK